MVQKEHEGCQSHQRHAQPCVPIRLQNASGLPGPCHPPDHRLELGPQGLPSGTHENPRGHEAGEPSIISQDGQVHREAN